MPYCKNKLFLFNCRFALVVAIMSFTLLYTEGEKCRMCPGYGGWMAD